MLLQNQDLSAGPVNNAWLHLLYDPVCEEQDRDCSVHSQNQDLSAGHVKNVLWLLLYAPAY